ncbi:MAG: NAD(+) synthase [Lachnospiraceae bacterium]|nr:NAD(+) synthase [Lachnospiraceae bacterium]
MTTFDAAKACEACVEWIKEFFEHNGPGCNAVLGISGGKDSSVAAALCVRALGKERVIGVRMPNGKQPDIDAAVKLCEFLGIRSFEVNIAGAYQAVMEELSGAGIPISEQARINLAPRIRMSTLYAVSQCHNGRVVNTCNLSEDWVGYSTRYGDAAGDFSPMAGFTVQEVKALGHYLGLPEELVEKVPGDGLCGKSDEDNLGFSYEVLDRYIRTGQIDDPELKERIDTKHERNLFKLQLMPAFYPDGQL